MKVRWGWLIADDVGLCEASLEVDAFGFKRSGVAAHETHGLGHIIGAANVGNHGLVSVFEDAGVVRTTINRGQQV